MRKAFNFYRSYYEVAKLLPPKEREQYLWAIVQKQFEGVEPTNLTGGALIAYMGQKHSIDAQINGYNDWCKNPKNEGVPINLHPLPLPPALQVQGEVQGQVQGQGQAQQSVAHLDFGFDEFWKMYPRKTNKAKATKIWSKQTHQVREKIMSALPSHVAHWQAKGTMPEFIPHPTTWLNDKRWEDELSQVQITTEESATDKWNEYKKQYKQ
jgi:hypothetical protein